MAWAPKEAPAAPETASAVDATAVLMTLAAILLTALILLRRKKGSSAPAAPQSTGAAAAAADAGHFPNGELLILWGSQTGTAETFGSTLMREARQKGFKARSVDLEDYDPEDLCTEECPVVLLMATHGEGEPTDNALDFYQYLNDTSREPGELSNVRFATFALGNKQYEHFCAMGKWAHAKLSSLGASAVHELGLGDDDDDMEADWEKWREGLWESLGAGADDGPLVPPPANFEASLLDAPSAVQPSDPPSASLTWLRKLFPKQTLVECEVKTNRELCPDPTDASVRHVELRTAKEGKPQPYLRYCTADDLAVCCDNGPALADETAALLGLAPAQSFALRPMASAVGVPPPVPTPCTVSQAMRFYVDLRAAAGKQLLLLLSAHASDPAEAARLLHLASPEGKDEYHAYVQRDGRGLTELLRDFPSAKPPLAHLLELVPKLTPRYYTISSSPAKDKLTVHMTVKVLREPMKGAPGRTKEGVCSTQLGALPPGSNAVVFVRESTFRLPRNVDTPVIMVGPGTGIAPFRAFVQEMEMAAARGKKRTGESRLYFGCRQPSVDYLYEDELSAALEAGVLTTLRTAFSRAQKQKVYVQDRLREDAELLWQLVGEKKGYVYICGGTSMGRDVVTLLSEIASTHGGKDGERYIKDMTAQGRLVQELWS